MLGEDHSVAHEFPEYKEAIAKLTSNDERFAKDAQKYNELDKEIRILELDGAPISDDELHQKKHERAALKDLIYKRLLHAND